MLLHKAYGAEGFIELSFDTHTHIHAGPPDAPRALNVVALSAYTIQVSWLHPINKGGRPDLYYQVEHSDPDNLGSYTGTVYLSGDATSHIFTDLRPFTSYCVRVIAHNGVSDQDPEGTHLRTVEDCVTTPEAGKRHAPTHTHTYIHSLTLAHFPTHY